jgi:hypothetical protein
MLRFKVHYIDEDDYVEHVGDRELKYDYANCQMYDPYQGRIKLNERDWKRFLYNKRDVCNEQREEQLSRPFLKVFFINEEDYARNVSYTEWDYAHENFMTYAPSLDYATGGGIRELNTERDWKMFIYNYRDEYNNQWEAERVRGYSFDKW